MHYAISERSVPQRTDVYVSQQLDNLGHSALPCPRFDSILTVAVVEQEGRRDAEMCSYRRNECSMLGLTVKGKATVSR